MNTFLWILLAAAIVFGTIVLLRWIRVRERARRRLGTTQDDLPGDHRSMQFDPEEPGLRRWLVRAGYNHPSAPAIFVGTTVAMTALGLLLVVGIAASGIVDLGVELLLGIPGNVGEVMVPAMLAAPWILAVTLALLPLVRVRARRRKFVESVEEDLPVTLDLMATLGEAGLGFDAGLTRVLEAEHRERPLTTEFRYFQQDARAGMPRVACLRRLARRVDVPTVSTFVSAVTQAEESGSGLAGILRQQAVDLRNRQRERGLTKAQSVPVKLVFPLVICFLPGLLVLSLGPAFHSLFKIIDQVTVELK